MIFENDAIEKPVKLIGISRRHEQSLAIQMDLRLNNRVLLEDQRGHERGAIASNEDLHRMVFHFAANALNVALGDNVSAAHNHNAIGNDVHLMKNVARNNNVHSGLGEAPEQFDNFGAGHRIESVE